MSSQSKPTKAKNSKRQSRDIRGFFGAQQASANDDSDSVSANVDGGAPEASDTGRDGGVGAGGGVDNDNENAASDDASEGDADESDDDGAIEDADDGDSNNNNNNKKEYWPPDTMDWFKSIMHEVNDAVKLKGRGKKAKYKGSVPQKYAQLFKPSDDPEAFFPNQQLQRKHFSYPHTRLWFPEALHPRYYPTARPPCKWHDDCGCVTLKGWIKSPRHCYSDDRIHALVSKRYHCSIREKQGLSYGFNAYDKEVIAKSHDYIKLLWRKT
eukprot:scaffold309871_cov36-Cyclotella_meneghiniana.AAC.1